MLSTSYIRGATYDELRTTVAVVGCTIVVRTIVVTTNVVGTCKYMMAHHALVVPLPRYGPERILRRGQDNWCARPDIVYIGLARSFFDNRLTPHPAGARGLLAGECRQPKNGLCMEQTQ